jgi:hypothetical protein
MEVKKISTTTKEQRRLQILLHAGNPKNEFPTRTEMGVTVCGYAMPQSLYRIFTPMELAEIEREALEMRRARFSPELAKIDKALIDRAAQGDTAAIKLAHQRFENYAPPCPFRVEKERMVISYRYRVNGGEWKKTELVSVFGAKRRPARKTR